MGPNFVHLSTPNSAAILCRQISTDLRSRQQALPVSVNPLLILLPSAALLGLAVCIAAATFKKYL